MKSVLLLVTTAVLLASGTTTLQAWSPVLVPTQNLTFLVERRVSAASDADPHNETSLAVSPVNDDIMVGASKVIVGAGGSGIGTTRAAYHFSSDGGATWDRKLVELDTPQKTWGRNTSASVAVDLEGNFYLAVLMLDNSSFDTGVYVLKSTDGGRTFGNLMPVFFDIGNPANPKRSDKPFLTVDTSPTSPFKNTIYVTWTINDVSDLGLNRTLVHTSYLRPNAGSFSPSKIISHGGDMRAPTAATGPNGELYCVWEGIGSPRVLLFNASTDGGDTFLPPEAAPFVDFNIHNFTGSLSLPSPVLRISGVQRMNSSPSIDVDRSEGPNRGMIYVVWAETSNRVDADVFLKQLTPPNGFRPTVSLPIKINQASAPGDQFFPAVSVDPTNGRIAVAYYSRSNPDGEAIRAFISQSVNGGNQFEQVFSSLADSNPRIQSNVITFGGGSQIGIGDHLAIKALRESSHLLWTDTRNDKQEIFYGGLIGSLTGGGGEPPLNDSCGTAREIRFAIPFHDNLDVSQATSATSDPVSCSGNQDTHSVWYKFTPLVATSYGIVTSGSTYDTVVSVYTGNCDALTRVACNDDVNNLPGLPFRSSVLVFPAQAGETYLLEVSGKGSGGRLLFRFGGPIITNVEYTKAPDGSNSLKVTGAGFLDGDARVVVTETNGKRTELPITFYSNQKQGDKTVTVIYGTKQKVKKLVKRGRPLVITVETPVALPSSSNAYLFTRQ